MKGLFLWQWSPDLTVGGPEDDSYTSHGKPAEVVVRRWFRHGLR
jgi:hypothetical protein